MATIGQGQLALLVIDMQNDVVANAWRRNEVVSVIQSLIVSARDASAPVLFVQHEDEELLRGTTGWHFVDGIAPRQDERVIAKRFPDSFAETGLSWVLAELGVSHLVIAGAQSMACIRTTAHRAMAEGYDVTLVADAHTTDDLDFGGVALSAEQIVGYINLCVQFTPYPGQEIQVVAHDAVMFPSPVGAGKSL